MKAALRRLRFESLLAWDRLRFRIAVPMECRPMWPVEDRDSPYASIRFAVGAREALVCYGRPSAGGRTVFGALVPYGELWRTGANEPTTLHLPFPARIAGLSVSSGLYSIYTVPGEEAWTLVLNRSTRQSGRTRDERGKRGNLFENDYTPAVRSAEVGRATIPCTRIPHIDQLVIRAEPVDDLATELLIEWETTRASIPIRIAR